jgi:hypothetical protein
MSDIGKRGRTGAPDRALMSHGGVLLVSLVAGCAMLGPAAFWIRGVAGAWATGAAAGACLAGGVAGLALRGRVALADRRRGPAAVGVVAGMLLRMAVPLTVVAVVYHRGGMLVQGGMAFAVVVLYLLMLAAEIWMALTASPQHAAGLTTTSVGSGTPGG